MGTCATIAFIDYCKIARKHILYISDQFNCDMGPEMKNGKKLIEYFNSIYLNKRNHDAKYCKMVQIIKKLTNDFDYDCDINFKIIPLEKSNNGKIYINLKTKYKLNKEQEQREIDFKNDVWSSWFSFPDYLYLVPLCNSHDIKVIDEDDNGINHERYIEKDNLEVFCFRENVGFVDPYYGEYIKHFYEEEIETESVYVEDQNDSITDKLIHELDGNSKESKKYVEIIAQYEDGDRDCLVVRTNDNKHVLFKKMK